MNSRRISIHFKTIFAANFPFTICPSVHNEVWIIVSSPFYPSMEAYKVVYSTYLHTCTEVCKILHNCNPWPTIGMSQVSFRWLRNKENGFRDYGMFNFFKSIEPFGLEYSVNIKRCLGHFYGYTQSVYQTMVAPKCYRLGL